MQKESGEIIPFSFAIETHGGPCRCDTSVHDRCPHFQGRVDGMIRCALLQGLNYPVSHCTGPRIQRRNGLAMAA